MAVEIVSASGIASGSTPISGGTDTRVLFDDAGTAGEDAGLTYAKTTNSLSVGDTSSGGILALVATLSTEKAGAISAANWQVNGADWENPIVGGQLNHNADGLNSSQMTSAITITAGLTYRVDITVGTATVGGPYFEMAGFTSSAITSVGTTTNYFIATTTASIFIKASVVTARFTVTNVSIKQFTAGTGDVTIDGHLKVRSIIQDAQGVNTLFLNNGAIGILSSNPTSAITIGTGGSIQVDRAGTYLIKDTNGNSLTAISMGVTNIMAFQNISGSGEAYYGTSNASASPGNVAIQCKGAFSIFVNGGTGNVGIGVTGPTANFHIKAGSASANTAPLKLNTGTLNTTAEAGTMEFLAERFYLTPTSIARQAVPGVLFTQTADKTVSNTVAETSVVGTGVGSMTLPANFFVAGKTLRIRIGGIYSTPAIATPSVTVKVKYGSTVLATVTTTSLLSGASNLEFDGEVAITCRTTGATGTVVAHGDIEYATGVAGTIAVDPLNNAGAATTIDTTASALVDITVTWDTATSTRIATSTVTTCEVIN